MRDGGDSSLLVVFTVLHAQQRDDGGDFDSQRLGGGGDSASQRLGGSGVASLLVTFDDETTLLFLMVAPDHMRLISSGVLPLRRAASMFYFGTMFFV